MRGTRVACPETPERAEIFLEAVSDTAHELVEPGAPELARISAVHDAGYLEFLESAWARWIELPGHGPEIMPNIHPNRNMAGRPDSIVGLSGVYQADCACPIGPGTWQAIQQSAQCAVEAARAVSSGQESYAYAMCRPPGHHAFADMAGGFCFLNNSAIAAQVLRDSGASRIAILDVDVHHGNGTQGIFYDRSDVFTVSLHGDPAVYYPFYAGYADETGDRSGTGYNLNIPLPKGTGDGAYVDALDPALDAIRNFAPDCLVIALGLDASEDDPLAFLQLTTEGFARVAEMTAAMNLPTVLVQEGGYVSDVLGTNLATFLQRFETARGNH